MVHFVVSSQAHHASVNYIWDKLAQYSNMSWHPFIQSSENTGSVPDGSTKMIGAERKLVNTSGKVLMETVTEWDEMKKYMQVSIDNPPPFANQFLIAFMVREEGKNVFVDVLIADLDLKWTFACFAPVLAKVLPSKFIELADGCADLKEEAAFEVKI